MRLSLDEIPKVSLDDLEALIDSIAHWENLRPNEIPGSETCPCCKRAFSLGGCAHCIIAILTGREQCSSTVFYSYRDACAENHWGKKKYYKEKMIEQLKCLYRMADVLCNRQVNEIVHELMGEKRRTEMYYIDEEKYELSKEMTIFEAIKELDLSQNCKEATDILGSFIIAWSRNYKNDTCFSIRNINYNLSYMKRSLAYTIITYLLEKGILKKKKEEVTYYGSGSIIYCEYRNMRPTRFTIMKRASGRNLYYLINTTRNFVLRMKQCGSIKGPTKAEIVLELTNKGYKRIKIERQEP